MSAMWSEVPLGDLVENLDRMRVPVSAPERQKRAGSIPYYGAAGPVGTIDVPLFDEDLLLVGEDGVQFFDPYKSKAYRISGPSWVNNHAHVLRPMRDRVDDRFLLHFLNHFDYAGYANGTTRLKLTQAAMNRIPVPLPPLDEQRRIVRILEDHLSRLDSANESLTRSRAKLLALERASIETAVRQALQHESSAVLTVGDLGRVTSGSTPLKSNRGYYDGGDIPWITSGELSQGLVTEPRQYITEKALRETSVKMIPAGSLLVAMYGEGKTRGTVAELGIPATTNQACAAITLDDKHASLKDWVHLVLRANYFGLRTLASGGVQPNLNLGLIKAMRLPIPRETLRLELLHRTSTVTRCRARLDDDVVLAEMRAANLRRSLLQSAFAGDLRVAGVADFYV